MAETTKIEWADATLNVINGCDVHSPGCTNCYAMRAGGRNLPGHPSTGLTKPSKAGHVWTGEVRFNEDALIQPLKWKKPRRIFWNAHGDMFHENVPDEWIDRCFAVMALTPQHIHMILTKRSGRMREYFGEHRGSHVHGRVIREFAVFDELFQWPIPNVWLGVSVEDQVRADERIPDLLATPVALRFLSCEPLLGPVELKGWLSEPWEEMVSCHTDNAGVRRSDLSGNASPGIDWVITGGESGGKSRPSHPDWFRTLRDQCAAADVPFHFKQWGEWKPLDNPTGGLWSDTGTHCARVGLEGKVGDPTGWPIQRVGKKRAGRLLDGVTHDGMPA